MERLKLRFRYGFNVVAGNKRSQCAEMVLAPGESEGNEANSHRGADQWLYVVSGSGTAIISDKRYPLKEGTVLLIERGEVHQIRNTGTSVLKTLNFYVPPAYSSDGDELEAGKASVSRPRRAK